MAQQLAVVVQFAGLLLVVVALWLLAPWLGLLVAGVALVGVGAYVERQ